MKSFLIVLLALGMATRLAAAQESASSYGNDRANGDYYEVNGIRIYCETYGSGSPVLMIHGNGGSIVQFEHNIPYFANKHRVIAADSRAQGKSRDVGPALTFEMMADDSATLLDQLHVASADVIGYSDGGITALLLALRHPEKVRRLAVTGANLRPDASAFAPGVWESAHQQYERDKDKVRPTETEKNDWKLFMLDWLEPNIPSTALHDIKCPSLIICGDHDIIALEHTLEIYRALPHAALWIVPHSPHSTLIAHADDFNRTVDAFFNATTPTGP